MFQIFNTEEPNFYSTRSTITFNPCLTSFVYFNCYMSVLDLEGGLRRDSRWVVKMLGSYVVLLLMTRQNTRMLGCANVKN